MSVYRTLDNKPRAVDEDVLSVIKAKDSYIRKLKGEIRMLQIRVREANRGARGNIMIAYNALKECDQLRKELKQLRGKEQP